MVPSWFAFDVYDMSKSAYNFGEAFGNGGWPGAKAYAEGADFADNVNRGADKKAPSKIPTPSSLISSLEAFVATNLLIAAAIGIGALYLAHKSGALGSFVATAKASSVGTAKALAGR